MANGNKDGDVIGDIEDKNQVVITPEDSAECAKFFEFFEIQKTPGLAKAFEEFQKNPTFMNQNELKFQLADIISTSDHPVFKDEVFEQVIPETRAVRDEMSFERELEKHLAEDPKPE